MGLFNKIDERKTYLRAKFNLKTQKYEFCIFDNSNREWIPVVYKDLSRDTKKHLDLMNIELKDSKNLASAIREEKLNQRQVRLEKMGYTFDSFQHLGFYNDTIVGSMSNEMEGYLNKLVGEDNVLIGIHRVGDISYSDIQDILTNGLYMTGHMGSGAYTSVDLRNNVSYYPDNRTIINELTTASDYKDSVGSILIRIPDCDLDKDLYITDESGFKRLNPKYIVGYVPCDKNYHIGNIVLPPKKVNISNPYFGQTFNRIYEDSEEYKRSRSY